MLHISLSSFVQVTTYVGSIEKYSVCLGKRTHVRKPQREDCELGYLKFTLALTFHLTHPQQKKHAVVPNAYEMLRYGGR